MLNQKTFMKKIVNLLLLLLLVGCEENLPQRQSFRIEKADADAIAKVKSWMNEKNTSSGGRAVPVDYDVNNLQLVTADGLSYYSALGISDPNATMTFVPDRLGNINLSFTTSSTLYSNGDILSRFYSSDGSMRFSFTNHPSGTRTWGGYYPPSIASVERSWWDNTNACFDKFHTFSQYSIVNSLVCSIFNAATLGIYTPLAGVFCAGVAGLM